MRRPNSDNIINNNEAQHNINQDNNNQLHNLPAMMARIDAEFHASDTPEEWNVRIRNNIKQNYLKDYLTNAQKQLFREWEDNVLNLRQNAHRLDLFLAAPYDALVIVGL